MSEGDPLIVIYLIVASIAIIGSLHVLGTILYGFRTINTCSTLLILFLHFSLVAEEISALPYLYKSDSTLCKVMEAFFEYFGLMNIVVVGFMVYAHRWSIMNPSIRIRGIIIKLGIVFIFLFPAITFLPFLEDIYTVPKDSPWCSLPYDSNSRDTKWFLGVYLIWVWVVLICSVLSTIDLTIRLSFTHRRILKSYLTSIGLYTLVSLLCWIPRTSARISGTDTNLVRFFAYLPIYISGMLYTLIFRRSRRNMEDYEVSRIDSYVLEQTDFLFLLDEKDRYSLTSNDDVDALLDGGSDGDKRLMSEDRKYFTRPVFESVDHP